MNAAAAKPFQIKRPGVLKGHGRDGKGVGPGPGEKTIQVILWYGLFPVAATARLLRGHGQRPLPGSEPDAFVPAFQGRGDCRRFAGGAAGGVTSTQGLQMAFFRHQKVAVKGAEGVFAAGWGKVPGPDGAVGLRLKQIHDLGQGQPAGIFWRLRKTAKIAHRLEMHPAHGWREPCGMLDDRADFAGIDPWNQSGDQHHGQPGSRAVIDGLLFDLPEIAASQRLVRLRAESIELEENRSQSRLFERAGIINRLGQPQAVGVELNKFKTLGPAKRNDGGQIFAQRRLAARELDIALTRGRKNPAVKEIDPLK